MIESPCSQAGPARVSREVSLSLSKQVKPRATAGFLEPKQAVIEVAREFLTAFPSTEDAHKELARKKLEQLLAQKSVSTD